MAAQTTTTALVTAIRSAVKADGLYSRFVTEHNVTRETVAEHAAALALLAFPVKGDATPVQKKDGIRTPYGNAVQKAGAGLRRAIGPVESDVERVLNLLTADGIKALADMDADAIAAAIAAEIARRNA